MGGMAAQIPVKGDTSANEAAFAKVKADKMREVRAGHDGTWVAHPDLVGPAMDVFNAEMTGKHQMLRKQVMPRITAESLLAPHAGTATEAGLRTNISVGITYIAAWLQGRGAVPIHNLMEDAATAEISRSQVWQWLRHGHALEKADGTIAKMTTGYFEDVLEEEMEKIRAEAGENFDSGHFQKAAEIFTKTATSVEFVVAGMLVRFSCPAND